MNVDANIQYKILVWIIQQHNEKYTLSNWGLFQKCKGGLILDNLLIEFIALPDLMKKSYDHH